MILEAPPLEGGKKICPVCGAELDGNFCRKCNVKAVGEKSPMKIYLDLREEEGKKGLGLFSVAAVGYDIRFVVPQVKNLLIDELPMYFQALEIFTGSKMTVLTHDQRQGVSQIKQGFERYCRERASGECLTLDGISPSTTSPFAAALFSVINRRTVLAVHATASHNPPEYNGIKSFYGRFEKDVFPVKPAEPSLEEISRSYAEFLLQDFHGFGEPFFFDVMHGAGWTLLKHLLPGVSRNVDVQNRQPLPDFGGTLPDPPETHGGKFGFAADGDMDRISPYYGGQRIPFSKFLAIAAELGIVDDRVVLDQRVAPAVVEFIRDRGVDALVGDVGRTNQEKVAMEQNAMWCEENWHSGGYVLKGIRFFWPDAPYGFLWALSRIGVTGVDRFFRVNVPEPLIAKKTVKASPGINERVLVAAGEVADNPIPIPSGGVRVESGDSHFIIRESNTELGVCRIYATGMNEQELKSNLNTALKIIRIAEKL